MPEPRDSETREEFLGRCIPELIEEEDRPQDQAVAICNSLWRERDIKEAMNAVGLTVGETLDLVDGMASKFEKAEVDYENPSSIENEPCNKCAFFDGFSRCEVVDGDIAPTAHSLLFILDSSLAEDAMIAEAKEQLQDDKTMHSDSILEDKKPPLTYAELEEMRVASRMAQSVNDVFSDFEIIKRNIMLMPSEPAEKVDALLNLVAEMKDKIADAMEQKAFEGLACKNCGGAILIMKEQNACGSCGVVYGDMAEIMPIFIDTISNRIEDFIVSHSKQTPMKTEGGKKFPSGDYAYVPDEEKPSTWKLRLTESPGKITVRQLGRAAAALSQGGFRGRKVQLPSDAVAGVKRRIRAEYSKLDVEREDMPTSVKSRGEFVVFKDTDTGLYRWVAVYSNKFRDRDNPPEILSDAAHRDFIKSVQSGDWAYPELWLAHIKGSRIGEVDFITYDDSGFPIATGIFDKGMEIVAESLADRDDILVSHGMPSKEIQRNDPDDPTVITRYRTVEISPLSYQAAANPLTGFAIVDGGDNMAIPDQDKAKLIDLVGEAAANAVEAANVGRAQKALDLELEHKEVEANSDAVESEPIEAVTVETEVETVTEPEIESETETVEDEVEGETETVEDEVESAPTAEAEPETKVQLTPEAIADAIKAGIEIAMQPLQEKIVQLEKTIEENQEREAEDTLKQTPAASLRDLVLGAYTRKDSVIGAAECRVDNRTRLAKDGPEETKNTHREGSLPAPFLNTIVEGGDWRKSFDFSQDEH